MVVNQIYSILNDVYDFSTYFDSEEQSKHLTALNQDLSNIADFGASILENSQYRTYSELFAGTIGNLIDKVGRTIFNTTEYVSIAPNIIHNENTWSNMIEMVRVDVGRFKRNTSWDCVTGTDTNSFENMFGMELPTVKAKYYNKKSVYENKITLTEKQFATAFNSPAEMSRFFAEIENRLSEKLDWAIDETAFLAFDSAVLETANTRQNVVQSELHTESGTVDKFVMQIKRILRDFTKYSDAYKEKGFITSTRPEKLRLAIRADVYDRIITSYANVFNPEFLKIPMENIDIMPYFQDATDSERIVGKVPSTTSGKLTKLDNVVAIIYDSRLVGCYNSNSRVIAVPVPNMEFTNFFHKVDLQYIVNTDYGICVLTENGISDLSEVNPYTNVDDIEDEE